MAQARGNNRNDGDEPALRLAVLIDADNSQAAIIEGLLAEIARFGEATVKRIYGDFTSPRSGSWTEVLQKFAIKPEQQFAFTKGKNATDIALIIDAMDLLYTQKFDGFCLVTSDSDFTGLAMRLKEEGLKVYGFGEEKTPKAFRNACTKFIETEQFRRDTRPAPKAPAKGPARGRKPASPEPPAEPAAVQTQGRQPYPTEFILSALEKMDEDESGWVNLGAFGSYLGKVQPDFDSRRYGYSQLSKMIKARTDLFEVQERPVQGSEQKVLYLRAR